MDQQFRLGVQRKDRKALSAKVSSQLHYWTDLDNGASAILEHDASSGLSVHSKYECPYQQAPYSLRTKEILVPFLFQEPIVLSKRPQRSFHFQLII